MFTSSKKLVLQRRVDFFSQKMDTLLKKYSQQYQQRVTSSEKEKIARLRKQISNSKP